VWILERKVSYWCRKLNRVSSTKYLEQILLHIVRCRCRTTRNFSNRIGDNQVPEQASQHAMDWESEVQFPADTGDLHLIRNVQNGSGAHSVSWASFSLGLIARGFKLPTHFHLVLRLKMSGPIHLLRHMPSWRAL
jgi:hypothetical protein